MDELLVSKFLVFLSQKSPDVFWIRNTDYSQQIYISPAYQVIWQRDPLELYEHPEKWADSLHPEDFVTMQAAIERRNPHISAEMEFYAEYRIIRPSGEVRYIKDHSFPIFDTSNIHIGFAGIARDVTEEVLMARKLLVSKNAAEAANRAKTEFLANMSHDMKTPLSGIVTTAEVIANDPTSQERDRQFAAIISVSGKQLGEFFTSCLNLSKLEMEEWVSMTSVFCLRKLVQDIYDLYLPKAKGAGLDLSVICDLTIPDAVQGHRDSLYRALLNLMGNALKFTQKGSVTLRVLCGEVIDEEHTRILFEVEDTGIGIPEDKFKVIFEKLQRLTPAYSSNIEGSGIGLYIVDQFIKRMGGSIHVDSELGKGSKFTVSVPMSIARGVPIDELDVASSLEIEVPVFKIPELSSTVDSNGLRVLLVEDVPIIQIATKSLLNGAGFYVDTVSSGQEALDLCESNNYGVIYMDMGLPDMQGYEAAALIRQQQKAAGQSPTPIIALTGHGATDVQFFCRHAGMQGVLSKPLLREHAEKVWQRYVDQQDVVVPGLTELEERPVQQLLFDLAATVAVLGSEQKAREMMRALIVQLQENYLPKMNVLVEQNDRAGLRFLLHQLMGCLSYAVFPPLQETVCNLHQALRDNVESIQDTYQRVEVEIHKVIQLAVQSN